MISWSLTARFSKAGFRILLVAGVAVSVTLLVGATASSSPSARVVVWKKVNTVSPAASFFLPVASAKPAAAGFSQLADYPSRALFRGPTSAASSLIAGLKAEGFDAELASDLDSFNYHDYAIDADTGQFTPRPPAVAYTPSGSDGLFFVALEGYPAEPWLADLARRNVRLVEGLAPAGYIARGPRSVMASLRESANYVRGVFPLVPSVKRGLFEGPPPPEPFRWVSIQASEESPADSIRPFLDSVSQEPVEVTWREAEKIRYEALLSDLDISTLITLENVYSVAPARPPVSLSSERQAVLITLTDAQAGTLPATSPDYNSYLTSHNIASAANTFDNTIVGLSDTGFDNGVYTISGIHPDFKFNFLGTDYATVLNLTHSPSYADNIDKDGHGTMTASVITGYASWGQRGENNYRYALGFAPTVRIVMDKTRECNSYDPNLTSSLDRLAASHPNVINMSWNDLPPGGCGYSTNSQIVDTRTRDPLLFTVSAGNSTPAGCSPNYVRSPATGKNVIAVGATENYTIGWATLTSGGTCLYNGYPPAWGQPQDARNVAYFSAYRDPASMVKPDLVAPGERITGPFTRGTLCNPPYGILCNTNIDTQGGVQYGMSAGTSFAAPAVAGAAAVVRKWYRNIRAVDPSPAMTKAMLINGARDIAGAWVRNQNFVNQIQIGHIPDPYQGWGMLSLDRLLGLTSQYYFFDQGLQLSPSGQWTKSLYVVNGARPTHLTLVWTDPPAIPPVTPYVIKNNLELQAAGNGGLTVWYSNLFNSQGYSTPNIQNHDSVNNVEQIMIAPNYLSTGAPLYLAISAVSLPGGNQDFAIMVDNAHE